MRVLLSTIGSRGEVQPLFALALELRALGCEVRFCVPPDFCAWLRTRGFEAVAIGPELRTFAITAPTARPSPEQMQQLARETVDAQFATVTAAAGGCDLVVAGGALQIAARSICEALHVRYVYASYCPITIPSPHHAPPSYGAFVPAASSDPQDHRAVWERDAQRCNAMFAGALNAHRATLGLPPVDDVQRHVFTDEPWLAADATLAPWSDTRGYNVVQTGAWMTTEAEPLPIEIERFLGAGDPPVYFGFGSMRVPGSLGEVAVESARALGRRAIVSHGWADLRIAEGRADAMTIGEVDHHALFSRVAAIVHHGGAGTTTTAARAGIPQVVVPQMYDQPYWAKRVEALGIGVALSGGIPTADALVSALHRVTASDTTAAARTIGASVRGDGARIAARSIRER